MNEAGIFVLIFDGFDEMAVRVDLDTLEVNLQEIEKLTAAEKTKAIITSRVEYFISVEEEKKSLSPKGQLLATRNIEYSPMKLRPWDQEQINLFLKKRVPLIPGVREPWTFYRDQINGIAGLSDLSKRPVLLDMIVKTLPQLVASDKPVNRPNLYETYLRAEIKRQKITKQRSLLLTEPARFSLLQKLGVDFYRNRLSSVNFSEAKKYVDAEVKPPSNELEHYTRDFLTCSFLVREKDEYRFSHRSILEYLVAKELLNEVETNKPGLFVKHFIHPVVSDFLVELNPDTNILWEWVVNTRGQSEGKLKYLGGNAITVLCHTRPDAIAGKNLSNTVVDYADLSFSDLRGINFNNTCMKKVRLIGAKYLKQEIVKAKLIDFITSMYLVGEFRAGRRSKAPLNIVIRDRITASVHNLIRIFSGYEVMPFAYRFDFNSAGVFVVHLIAVFPDFANLLRAAGDISPNLGFQNCAIFSDEIDAISLNMRPSFKSVIEDKRIAGIAEPDFLIE